MSLVKQRFSLALLLLVITGNAWAHADATGMSGGFFSGFTHPLFGWDHVAAMVAVGLWGAFLGRPALWMLPVVFPVVMAGGGVLGIIGIPIPGIEIGIALSALVLGLMVLFAVRPPLLVTAVLVGTFAIFHGHAHGTELPDAANPLAYSLGFVIATGLLHLSGIALGELTRWSWGGNAVRAGGALISLVGVGFLTGML